MIPAAELPEPSRPRRLLAELSLLGGRAALLAMVIAGVGCGKAPRSNSNTSDDKTVGALKGDPWAVAGSRLKKETDLATCKSVLGGLRTDTGTEEGKKLPALSDDALAALGAIVPLSPADVDQIRGGPFTEHDPVYLADCFYLRDAARSLALAGLAPQRQAELAFEWVCRQVYLQPWPQRVGASYIPTALPPTAVLRRGFGSGLERAYVFLALMQQLELDACLIGGPDAVNLQSRQGPALQYPFLAHLPITGVQRGPFWAIGVRTDSDVRLFDPWRGEPFPVTLSQLKANPEAARAWFEDKANLSKATLEDAKSATVYLAVPVNALSARMAAFDSHLKGELGVRVSVDARALRAAFSDPKPAFWNPPEDSFAYGRCARSYLPRDLGGSDPAPFSMERLYESSLFHQIPPTIFKSDPGLDRILAPLSDSVRDRLVMIARNWLAMSFVEPPNPRERIQRGEFQEAAREVVGKQEMFAGCLERLHNNKDADQQINNWVEEAKRLYTEVSRAQVRMDKEAETTALSAVEVHWKSASVQLLMDRATAEVGQAEASLLLALCKHEQAERVQVRLERASGPEAAQMKSDAIGAWQTALSAWKTYEQSAAAHAGFPGRAEHAKALAARAAKLAEADTKK